MLRGQVRTDPLIYLARRGVGFGKALQLLIQCAFEPFPDKIALRAEVRVEPAVRQACLGHKSRSFPAAAMPCRLNFLAAIFTIRSCEVSLCPLAYRLPVSQHQYLLYYHCHVICIPKSKPQFNGIDECVETRQRGECDRSFSTAWIRLQAPRIQIRVPSCRQNPQYGYYHLWRCSCVQKGLTRKADVRLE